MSDTSLKFSDYIVYVDESGDHSLESINLRYPLFVLAFGLSVLRPEQPNRAFAILEKKLYRESKRERGPFVFPLKAKSPEGVLEAQTPVG